MKQKQYVKRLCAAALALALLLAAAGCDAFKKKVPTTYPWVFVHGLNGFGDDANLPLSYWGATGGDLLPTLESLGYECYAPTVSAAGSAWDRACELYAQLVGGRVDYGAAHSEKCGHARYGTLYEAPLIPSWGAVDPDGNLRKINLIAHSFGGATARVLCALLQNGSDGEQGAAAAAGTECSALFTGGKGDWVFSLTCLAAPHNGVSLLTMIDVDPIIKLGAGLAGIVDFDAILAAAGISLGGQMSVNEFLNAAKSSDTAYADLSLNGAKAVNALTCVSPHTYYFSYPVDGTDGRRGTNDMSDALRFLAGVIGGFTHAPSGIDDSWRPNDGLVNTISATAPFGEDSETVADPAALQPKPGLWYVMPTVRGDHGSVIGLGRSLEETLPLYTDQMARVDALSLEVTG